MKKFYLSLLFATATQMVYANSIAPLTKTTAHGRNEVLPKRMLRDPKAVNEGTKNRAMPEERGRLQLFENIGLAQRKSPSEIFKNLQVDGNALETLKSTNMKKLTESFDHPGLIKHFNSEYKQDVMTLALVDAIEHGKSTATFENLLKEQIQLYVDNGMSLDQFLNVLKMDADFSPLTRIKMRAVQEFFKSFNQKNNRPHEKTLIDALVSVFHGEDKLTEAIGTAKLDPRMKRNAIPVEDLLIQKWDTHNWSPSVLLNNLHLDQSVDALSSPSMVTVTEFISKYNKKNPNNKFSLLAHFTKQFEDDAVAMALVKAKKEKATEGIAANLQNEQFKSWQSRKESVVDLLKLKSDGKSLLPSIPKMEVLRAYFVFNKKKPSDQLSILLDALGDRNLAITLSRAIKSPNIEDKDIYKVLQKLLFQRWSHLDPSSVRSKYFMNIDDDMVPEVESVLKIYEQVYKAKTSSVY